jgi:hypothetical protein
MQANRSKETVLVITVGLVAIGLITHKNMYNYAAAGLGLAGALSNDVASLIDKGWTKLSEILGVVSNTILLTIVFVVVLTPVGLIRRRNPKNRITYFNPNKTTNMVDRDHLFTKADFERTW